MRSCGSPAADNGCPSAAPIDVLAAKQPRAFCADGKAAAGRRQVCTGRDVVKIGIAVVAMSVGLGASAASAQPGWYGYGYGYRYGSPRDAGEYYGSLPPRHLMSVVRAAGLRPISHP